MMHRYWGDGDPHYAEKYAYCPDPIYRDFVMNAMALADGQIGQLVRYTGHHRDTVLVVAASMGQAPIPYHENTDAFLVLEDGKRLAAALGFPSGRERLTMHPMCSIEFANPAEAESAADVLAQVTDQAGRSVFQAIEARGRSVTFNTHYEPIRNADLQVLNIPKVGRNPTEMRTVSFGDAGLAARARVGGGNTAYHIPEGIVLSYVNGGVADSSREEVDILDMSPSLLSTVLDAPVPLEMRGNVRCDLFA